MIKKKGKKGKEKWKHGVIEGMYELNSLKTQFENQLESVPIL